MRKVKKINGFLIVRFNDRERREQPGLGAFGVIDAELYTGQISIDLDAMEYDDADCIEVAVEQARGLDAEEDYDEGEPSYTLITETASESTEEDISPQLLISSWEHQLKIQIGSRYYPDVDRRTAAHELYGFKMALLRLGLIDESEVGAEPAAFEPESPDTPSCGDCLDDGYRVTHILVGNALAEFSSHDFEELERIPGCTVQVLRCRRCGHESYAWSRRGEDPSQGEVENLRRLLREINDYANGEEERK